ncbi:SRPBCC family protein [Actinoallomurus oryzae]|uniref:SRPBCC family protein n=1 Tax=Actinoallomurus oryzae TaxID=502180 RepID=A0ABP8QWU2_9ACTN|nr:Rieske 2Fe-2S domain-containing protein [Actinoallomurus sp. NBC_01490]
MADVDRDVTVPRRVWADGDVHKRELARIFRTCWQFVAHDSEIPEPGDYVTRRIGRDSVIVTRDETGQVRVLLNTCRHRGVPLCRADRGNTSHFRCSYHGWTYANTGELRGVTFQRDVYGKGGIDKNELGLFQAARVDSVYGLVFATWDPDAPALEDYLGPMRWYLHTVFGKFDQGLEVVGPPVRTMVRANWKPEGENLSGDGYHTFVTHQSAVELGLFASQDDLARMAAVAGPRFTGRTVHCGNGHTMRIQRMPLTVDAPAYFGYPREMWDEFDRNLSEPQREAQSCLSVGHGSIFPNMSFLENFKTNVDKQGDHARYIRVTLRYPLGPAMTEQLWFLLQPRHADAGWLRLSRLAYLRTNGPAGMFEVDDTENFVGITEAAAGDVAADLPIVLDGGRHHPPTPQEAGWPGDVADGDRTEKTIRAFHGRWQELMA